MVPFPFYGEDKIIGFGDPPPPRLPRMICGFSFTMMFVRTTDARRINYLF